jgi:CSLREA domain-containing protein
MHEPAVPSPAIASWETRELQRPGVMVKLLGLTALFAILTLAMGAAAAEFTVNSTADAGDAAPGNGLCETAPGNGVCTLRAAVQETNALAGTDTIRVPAGTYALLTTQQDLHEGEDHAVSGDLDLTDDLTLRGAGAAQTVLTMLPAEEGTDRVFDLHRAPLRISAGPS